MERKVNKKAVVIGGVNMDIGGSPAGEFVMRDSNPGHVTVRPGGVGRNIAHNLRLLGLDVSLIAAIGGDVYGTAIMDSCQALGMDMSMAPIFPERRSSTYLYVNDGEGDMHIAISDMDICRCITPEYLVPLMEKINQADAVVLDTNLTEETIRYIAMNCKAPLYVDPVSTVKAEKLKGLLGCFAGIKPNMIEAEKLTGENEPEKAAKAMISQGTGRVFLSLGSEGMLAAEADKLVKLPIFPARVINTTGAGDAAMATVVWAGVQGLSLEDSLKAAQRAGALATECVEANNPRLSPETISG